MKYIRRFILAVIALASLIPVSSAFAHQPVWGDEDVTAIHNLTTSFAFYRDLPAGKIHLYTFNGKQGQNLHAGINIPAVKGLEEYSVTMALFGPGLPEADHDLLPPEHPEDLGALILFIRSQHGLLRTTGGPSAGRFCQSVRGGGGSEETGAAWGTASVRPAGG